MILAGCNSRSESVDLEGEVVVSSDSLATPISATIVNGVMVVSDLTSDAPYHLIDLDRGEYIGGTAERGEGPGEIGSPADIVSWDDSASLYLYDSGKRRLVPAALTHAEIEMQDGFIDLTRAGMITSIAAVDGERDSLVGTGLYHNPERFVRINVTPEASIEHFGAEVGGPDGVPVPTRLHGWQGVVEVTDDGYAVGYRFADSIDLYDRDGMHVRRLRGIDGFEPEFGPMQDGTVSFTGPSRQRYGYMSLAGGREHLYALFSGRDGTRGDSMLGNEIHVYTYGGDLAYTYTVDHDLYSIIIDANTGALYGLAHYPEVAIVRYVFEH